MAKNFSAIKCMWIIANILQEIFVHAGGPAWKNENLFFVWYLQWFAYNGDPTKFKCTSWFYISVHISPIKSVYFRLIHDLFTRTLQIICIHWLFMGQRIAYHNFWSPDKLPSITNLHFLHRNDSLITNYRADLIAVISGNLLLETLIDH